MLAYGMEQSCKRQVLPAMSISVALFTGASAAPH